MPTYTYHCPECGHEFDLFHSMSDESVKHCPECGAEAQRKIGAGMGLIFKGSGFYITDYKNGHTGGGSNGNGHAHGSNGNGHTHEHAAPEKNGSAAKSDAKPSASETRAPSGDAAKK